jgi:hypothetical protein
MKHLPLPYYWNTKAWMTSTIWTTILKDFNRKLQTEKRKIILFCDNAACHKVQHEVELPNIKIAFLPPNTTSIIQPLDQGIIRCCKVYYRQAISRCQLSFLDKGEPQEAFSKHVDILRSMRMLKHAWWLVTPTTIQNCFRKAGFVCQDEETAAPGDTIVHAAVDAEINSILTEFANEEDQEKVLLIIEEEDKEVCYGEMTDAELLAETTGQDDTTEPIDMANLQSPPAPPITMQQVMSSLSVVRTFLEENSIDSEDPECFLRYFDLERAVVKKSTFRLRQITLDRFITISHK